MPDYNPSKSAKLLCRGLMFVPSLMMLMVLGLCLPVFIFCFYLDKALQKIKPQRWFKNLQECAGDSCRWWLVRLSFGFLGPIPAEKGQE